MISILDLSEKGEGYNQAFAKLHFQNTIPPITAFVPKSEWRDPLQQL